MLRSEWAEDPSVKNWKQVIQTESVLSVEDALAIKEANTGDPFERALDDILNELRETMLRKHADYGPLNIAHAPGGAINGLRVRMHDKLARINNLFDKGIDPENESVQDSYLDISNYGIIGLMVLRGHWPGTER